MGLPLPSVVVVKVLSNPLPGDLDRLYIIVSLKQILHMTQGLSLYVIIIIYTNLLGDGLMDLRPRIGLIVRPSLEIPKVLRRALCKLPSLNSTSRFAPM